MPARSKEMNRIHGATYRKKHRARLLEKDRQRSRESRKKIIELLGGECVGCGFSDPRALQIDHVNGDGYKERRRTPGKTTPGSKTYLKRVIKSLESGENRFQLLCANCNWIKRYENNEHGKR